jgi:hypothetical protein
LSPRLNWTTVLTSAAKERPATRSLTRLCGKRVYCYSAFARLDNTAAIPFVGTSRWQPIVWADDGSLLFTTTRERSPSTYPRHCGRIAAPSRSLPLSRGPPSGRSTLTARQPTGNSVRDEVEGVNLCMGI